MVVIVLKSAGLSLTAEERARITDCTDLDQLDAWIRRVALVNSVSELFDDPLHGRPSAIMVEWAWLEINSHRFAHDRRSGPLWT